MDNKTGKFILSLRQEKGLSQYQLAEMIPISRQAVSKWERGENIPDSYTLLKLSEIFNVTINELLLGERQLDNTVESLEKTTLDILDQSNMKTRKIKRMLIIFTTIITVLLLSFLSYYFITSYNSIKVYIISGSNGVFNTKDGLFVTTREKYYLKLSNLKYTDDIKINNIKFCYEKNGKEVILNDDIDIDNITLYNHHGYSEIFDKSDILMLMNNSYLKINYNDNKEDILKLKFKKDFMNNSLFVKKKKEWKNTEIKEAQIIKQEEVKEEEKKEETKPEEEKKEETPKKEETKPVINTPKEEPKVEEPVQEEITIEKIIEKIKEKGTYGPEGYFYETTIENNTITYMYGDAGDVVMMFDLLGDYWEYDGNTGRYTCTEILDNDLCKNHVHENAKKYLFN